MKTKYIIPALFFLVTLSGCGSMLDLKPKDALPSGSVGEKDLESLLIGVYDGAQSNDELMLISPDNAADNLKYTGTFQQHGDIDRCEVPTTNTWMNSHWNQCYTPIEYCNQMLMQLDKFEDTPRIKEMRGETRFIRAWYYAYLTMLWGDVVLVDKPKTLELTPRTPEAQVWAFIIEDLKYAADNAPAYSKAGYVSREAAKAVLARTLLWAQGDANRDLTKAAQLAEEVIASPKFALAADYDDIWQWKSQEILLQWVNRADDYSSFPFYLGLTSLGGRYELGADLALVNAYEPGDLRKAASVVEDPTTAGKWACYKYRASGLKDDPWPVVRIAEMYLVSAEAQGYPAGVARLNDLRVKRGLPALVEGVDITADNFMEKIMQERRVELAFEGFRWYDLRRWFLSGDKGKAAVLSFNKLQPTEPVGSRPTASETMNIAENGYNLLFPLGADVMDMNPASKPNNPGY